MFLIIIITKSDIKAGVLMSIQKYKALLKTVECGSFTEAAKVLDYSQSGISRMINDLENDWGISLLKRNHYGVSLTSDGLKVFPNIVSICAEHDRLKAKIDELHGLDTGFIRIGTFSSAATHWLPNIIKIFQTKYPNIEYELLIGDYTEIEEWVLNGRVDCGFTMLPVSPEIESQFVERDRLLVILPKDHPLAEAEKFPIKNICDGPFILLKKGGRAEVTQIFNKYKIKPQIRFETLDDYAVMSMVECGLGISVLPELILKRAPYNIVVKELDVPAYRSIGLIFKDKKSLPLAVKRFIEYIKYRNGD